MARNFELTSDIPKAPPERRLREAAYALATREARRYLLDGDRSYLDIRARLDELIAEGRRDLVSRRVAADDIEAWDMSYRAMFLICAWRPS